MINNVNRMNILDKRKVSDATMIKRKKYKKVGRRYKIIMINIKQRKKRWKAYK